MWCFGNNQSLQLSGPDAGLKHRFVLLSRCPLWDSWRSSWTGFPSAHEVTFYKHSYSSNKFFSHRALLISTVIFISMKGHRWTAALFSLNRILNPPDLQRYTITQNWTASILYLSLPIHYSYTDMILFFCVSQIRFDPWCFWIFNLQSIIQLTIKLKII